LCVQVGLCLDLARLGFVRNKQLKGKRSSAKSEMLASEEGSQQPASLEESSASDPELKKFAELSVDRDELRDCLTRAGKLLAAVQMDMDRHHDEVAAEAAKANKEKRETNEERARDRIHRWKLDWEAQGAATAEEEAQGAQPWLRQQEAQGALQVEDGLEGTLLNDRTRTRSGSRPRSRSRSPLPLCDEQGAQTGDLGIADSYPQDDSQSVAALGIADSYPQDDSQSAAAVTSPDSAEIQQAIIDADALLTPSFGEFLDQQLLPLYVLDVPFETLKHLVEGYCGLPLNSDDERKAWNVLGLRKPRPVAPTKKILRPPPSSPSGGSVASSSVSTVALATVDPSPPPAGPSLAALCEVMEKPKQTKSSMGPPLMRQMMTNSVVMRQGKESRAPRDMDTALFTRSTSTRRSMKWPAATPNIKPSSALLSSPVATPGELMSRFAASCAPSPISMRKTSRGRLEHQLQSSVLSAAQARAQQFATPQRRSRSPHRALQTPNISQHGKHGPNLLPSAGQPNWNLLDTPAR